MTLCLSKIFSYNIVFNGKAKGWFLLPSYRAYLLRGNYTICLFVVCYLKRLSPLWSFHQQQAEKKAKHTKNEWDLAKQSSVLEDRLSGLQTKLQRNREQAARVTAQAASAQRQAGDLKQVISPAGASKSRQTEPLWRLILWPQLTVPFISSSLSAGLRSVACVSRDPDGHEGSSVVEGDSREDRSPLTKLGCSVSSLHLLLPGLPVVSSSSVSFLSDVQDSCHWSVLGAFTLYSNSITLPITKTKKWKSPAKENRSSYKSQSELIKQLWEIPYSSRLLKETINSFSQQDISGWLR